MHKTIFATSLSTTLLLFSTIAYSAEIILTGSETVAGFVEEHKAEFESTSGHTIVLNKSGSSKGFSHVLQGGNGLGMTSRPPKDSESSNKIQLHQIGTDAAVFVVHFFNKTRNINTEQLSDLFSGKTTSWGEINDTMDKKVSLYGPQKHHGTFSMVRKLLGLTEAELEKNTKLSRTHSKTLKLTAIEPGAIGFISMSAWEQQVTNYASRVNKLSVNGVEPTRANIDSGSYTFRQPLYLISAGDLSKAEAQLVDYLKAK